MTALQKAAAIRDRKGKLPIAAVTAYDYPTARLLDESGVDVLLVGDMRRFGADKNGRHAVRLVAPPVLSANGNNGTAAHNETITFQYWSWGFQPTGVEGLPFDPAQNAFTIAMTRRQFAANFEIIVAEPKPI